MEVNEIELRKLAERTVRLEIDLKAALEEIALLRSMAHDEASRPGKSDIDRLKNAITFGPLSKGSCSSTQLNSFNRTWRTIMRDLKKSESDIQRRDAEDMLLKIGVTYVTEANNKRTFFTF